MKPIWGGLACLGFPEKWLLAGFDFGFALQCGNLAYSVWLVIGRELDAGDLTKGRK